MKSSFWIKSIVAFVLLFGMPFEAYASHKNSKKRSSHHKYKKRKYHKRSHKKRRKYLQRKCKSHLKNNELTSNVVNPHKYSKHTQTNKPYLEFKAIDGPLPQDYAALYLKSKTLNTPTRTHVKILIDKSIQRIFVYRDFEHMYTFKTSTGKAGHRTPSGVFRPYSMEEIHYSKKYNNSPMPWSVFFNGGIAIHGTNATYRLGHTASHGCVRAHPKSAKKIYKLIRRYGTRNTTIIVTN